MPPHRFDLRVYYEDTDAGGVVYHANYLRFMERGRSEALAGLGVEQAGLLAAGIGLVVRRIEVVYLAPARLLERLVVTTEVRAVGAARVGLVQGVWRDEVELVRAGVEIACLSAGGRPVRWPGAVRKALGRLTPAEGSFTKH